MLASADFFDIATAILEIGVTICVALVLLVMYLLHWKHPLPSELKKLSEDERNKIARSFSEEHADVDPAQARLWRNYVLAGAPLSRGLPLLFLAALILLLALALTFVLEPPISAVSVVLSLALVAANVLAVRLAYRKHREIERYVAQVRESR
jgi:hypothetical protein